MIRKGEIGDWKKHYSKRQLKSINDIIKGNTTFFIRLFYYLLFTLRRSIGSIE